MISACLRRISIDIPTWRSAIIKFHLCTFCTTFKIDWPRSSNFFSHHYVHYRDWILWYYNKVTENTSCSIVTLYQWFSNPTISLLKYISSIQKKWQNLLQSYDTLYYRIVSSLLYLVLQSHDKSSQRIVGYLLMPYNHTIAVELPALWHRNLACFLL